MTFLFNSDAQRGAVFGADFARELPHLPFAIGPAAVPPADIRYVITWSVPEALEQYRNLEHLGEAKAAARIMTALAAVTSHGIGTVPGKERTEAITAAVLSRLS